MRLLVTNAQEIQAYTIIRCLRSEAERIVITEGGHSVGGTPFRGMAAYSRFVDASHEVPHFASDWLAGRLQPENSSLEEQYIARIEEICDREGIDTIFPSLDPEVYLFAKNKKRLEDRGILTVVPEPDVIRVPMNKALTIQAAQQAGFPTPKTWFPASESDVAEVARESAPPWIVKPRFTAHGASMVYVEHPDELAAAYVSVRALQRDPIVQEYIRGLGRRNFYVTVDREGQLLSVMSPRVIDTWQSGYRVASKSCVSGSKGPYLDELEAMLKHLKIWGGYTIQTKIDARDGTPRLLEINPRLGQHTWWRTELGVNEPRILLQLARGERPDGNLNFPEGTLVLDSYHDFAFLYDQCIGAFFRGLGWLLRRPVVRPAPVDGHSEIGVLAALRQYVRRYLNRKPKVFSPEVASFASDPYPCLRAFGYKFFEVSKDSLRSHAAALRAALRRPGNRAEAHDSRSSR